MSSPKGRVKGVQKLTTEEGTSILSRQHRGGAGSVEDACMIWSSRAHWMGLIITVRGRIGSGEAAVVSGDCI